jgi:molybdopterin synthase catalytic subunit
MIALRDEPLEVAEAMAAVVEPDHGGIALFVGTTRRERAEGGVESLFYEAYEELALAEMEAIARGAERAFSARVAVLHRTGEVGVGEPSVIVAASAGHRPAAFAACRLVIDQLKERVPIWKRDVTAAGPGGWQDGAAAAVPPAVSA